MNHQEAKRKAQRMQSNREELVERMARALPADGILEVFPGFFLGRLSQPTEMQHSLFKPALRKPEAAIFCEGRSPLPAQRCY